MKSASLNEGAARLAHHNIGLTAQAGRSPARLRRLAVVL